VHAAEFVPRSTNQPQQYNYMQHAPTGPTWQQQMAMQQQQQQQFDPYNSMPVCVVMLFMTYNVNIFSLTHPG
jgi:hypothetical protein